jgi:hypothetical protein
MYGYQSARVTGQATGDPRLVAYPEHLASWKGVVPVIPELVSMGARLTLEAPRRVDTSDDGLRTQAGVIGDVTVSGHIKPFGVRYVIGVYNVADFRPALPVLDSFKSRAMPQFGRTFLLDLIGTYP